MKRITMLFVALVGAALLFGPAVSAQEVMTIKSGNVGINAPSPVFPLDVRDPNGGIAARVFGGELNVRRSGTAPPAISFQSDIRIWSFTTSTTSGLFGIRDATAGVTPLIILAGAPSSALVLNTNGSFSTSTGASLTSSGIWLNASSRDYKDSVELLSADEAVTALAGLDPVRYRHKASGERHVGFIAEDVPELVASADRKGLSAMDIVAVLTRVVQEQQDVISGLNERLAEVETELATRE